MQGENYLAPIEVRAEENLRSKSLRQFCLDYPDAKAYRISMSDYREQDWMINVPLYAAIRVPRMIEGTSSILPTYRGQVIPAEYQ